MSQPTSHRPTKYVVVNTTTDQWVSTTFATLAEAEAEMLRLAPFTERFTVEQPFAIEAVTLPSEDELDAFASAVVTGDESAVENLKQCDVCGAPLDPRARGLDHEPGCTLAPEELADFDRAVEQAVTTIAAAEAPELQTVLFATRIAEGFGMPVDMVQSYLSDMAAEAAKSDPFEGREVHP